jgi:hypothetical protein
LSWAPTAAVTPRDRWFNCKQHLTLTLRLRRRM